ncbi:AAA family ATPase [bacterium]|nr:AAA family ATPase [bacterium]
MDIKTFNSIAPRLPAEIAILIQGPTGIGKSHLVHAIGSEMELPVVDRRLSQMSEGDMVGLPELVDGTTRFCPPDWYARACKEPVVLFMDELNRATPEVIQAAFQIVLDRELNGHKLHPDTRVFAAVNVGSEYEVNEMDPALLRRFWSIELEPTHEDFLNWAEGRLAPVIVDFIRQHAEHLRPTTAVEPGKVAPNPASWERLDTSLKHMGEVEQASDIWYPVALGMVGVEAAISLVEFAKNWESQVSAEDIVGNYKEVQAQVKEFEASKINALIGKLVVHCKENSWTASEAKNVAAFASDLPSSEMLVHLWNQVSSSQKLKNIQKLHKLIGKAVVDAVNAGRQV